MSWGRKLLVDHRELTIEQAREQFYPHYNCPDIALHHIHVYSWDDRQELFVFLPRNREYWRRFDFELLAPFTDFAFDYRWSVEVIDAVKHKEEARELSESTLMELGFTRRDWSGGSFEWEHPMLKRECFRDRRPTFDELWSCIWKLGNESGRGTLRAQLKGLLNG